MKPFILPCEVYAMKVTFCDNEFTESVLTQVTRSSSKRDKIGILGEDIDSIFPKKRE
jgi:hypothetical protein